MPKASFAKKDTVKGGLNFEEGWFEIVEASSIVHEFPPSKETGETFGPGCNVRLMLQRTDADGHATVDDPIEEFFSCGNLEEFHPGKASGADDDDPDDQGDELGAEGNSIVSVNGKKMSQSSKWIRFVNSLEAKGFSAEVLANGYLPDLVGTRGFATTIELPKGRNYTGKNPPKALIVDKLTVKPYEKAKKGAAKAVTAASGKTAAKPNSKAPAADENGDAELSAKAIEMLQAVAVAAPGSTLTQKQISAKLVSVMAKNRVPAAEHKKIQDLVKDAGWLEEQCTALEYGFDGGEVTFPAAE